MFAQNNISWPQALDCDMFPSNTSTQLDEICLYIKNLQSIQPPSIPGIDQPISSYTSVAASSITPSAMTTLFSSSLYFHNITTTINMIDNTITDKLVSPSSITMIPSQSSEAIYDSFNIIMSSQFTFNTVYSDSDFIISPEPTAMQTVSIFNDELITFSDDKSSTILGFHYDELHTNSQDNNLTTRITNSISLIDPTTEHYEVSTLIEHSIESLSFSDIPISSSMTLSENTSLEFIIYILVIIIVLSMVGLVSVTAVLMIVLRTKHYRLKRMQHDSTSNPKEMEMIATSKVTDVNSNHLYTATDENTTETTF
jgi:hypothetical protein